MADYFFSLDMLLSFAEAERLQRVPVLLPGSALANEENQ